MPSQAKIDSLLDPEQQEAIESLGNGKILHGGVGSGKSRTLAAYYALKVMPAWQEELLRKQFDGEVDRVWAANHRGPNVHVITTARKRDLLDWEHEFALFGIGTEEDATCGGVLQVDSWNNIKEYVDVKDAFFIFDEQRLVGNGTWVKSFIKIAKNNTWVMASATPGDTWMDYIPVFVANGFYKNRTEFKRKHVVEEWHRYARYPILKGYVNEFKLETLRNRILVEMQNHRHTVRHLEYMVTEYDKVTFNRIRYDRWNPFDDKPVKDAGEMWRLLRKLVNTDPSRIYMIQRVLVEKYPRLIIFYNFDYELRILINNLTGIVPVFQYNGHVHDPLPEGDRWVYLVQYVAGAEAWNCVTTNTTALYSLPDSYKNFEQAQGRTDRRDTPFTDLFYFIFVSNSPRDIANRASLESKKDFNERKWAQELEQLEQLEEMWEGTEFG